MLCLLNDYITKHDNEMCKLSICTCLKIHFCQLEFWNLCLQINAMGTYFTICQRFLNKAFSTLIWNPSCSWDLVMTFPSSGAMKKNLSSNFIKDFNNLHPTINFQVDSLSPFLWCYVKLHNGHKTVHYVTNPQIIMDTYILLAEHTIKSIVYSQTLYYNSFCFNPLEMLNWWH